MEQERLIEKVRQYEFLYNVHSEHYRDQNMRHEAWEEIGRDLKITASQAKDIWSKLRNCLSNALKRRNAKKSGQAAKKYVPWKFEKQMEFLQPYMDSRQTLGNLSQSDNLSQLSEEESQMIADDEPDNAEEYSAVSSPSTSNAGNTSQSRPPSVPSPPTSNAETTSQSRRPSVPSPSTSNASQSRKRRPNPAEEMVDIMKKNCELRMQRAEHKFPNNLNETDMFYLSMSKTIQRLPQVDQIRIRMEMCRLVSEAEMHQLQTPRHNRRLTSPQLTRLVSEAEMHQLQTPRHNRTLTSPQLTSPQLTSPQLTSPQPTSTPPVSPQPASPSQIYTQPPIYHTLTPMQPNSPFQSQPPTYETHYNETDFSIQY